MAASAQVANQSPVKHTSDGEMPDSSPMAVAAQKLRGATIVMSNRAKGLPLLAPVILGGLIIGGIYLLVRSGVSAVKAKN